MATGTRPTVLFLHPSDELYGADRQLLALVDASRSLCRPVVLLPDDVAYSGRLTAELRDRSVEVRHGRVPVLRRRYARFRSFLPWAIGAVTGWWWVVRVARKERARLIVTNSAAIPIGPAVAATLRVPHAWFVREIITVPAWFKRVVRVQSRMSPGLVLTVSNAVAAWLGPIPGRGPSTLHDGVTVPDERAPLPDQPSAVFVGRLNAWKGWEVFVRAAGQAHARVPRARFQIVGGVVQGGTISQADVRSVLDAVDHSRTWLTWMGEMADGRAAMREAWLVTVPSVRPDPFPNVVIEAMSEARAVIGSSLGGIPEMVSHDETGLLVPPDDSHALAEAMVRILSDRSMAARLGEAGYRRVAVEFSSAHFTLAWQEVLRSHLDPGQ